jgi:trans-aconitate methyltransferase
LASKSNETVSMIDIGCGVGNAMFPLCSQIPNLKVNGFDFAAKAVDLV